MKNSGVIVANDASNERLKAVIGNIHRLGTQFFACITSFLTELHDIRDLNYREGLSVNRIYEPMTEALNILALE